MNKRDVIADNLADYLAQQEEKDTLRFITCGSVDDGKSTLIGRLLYESKAIFDDQLASLDSDSRKYGTQDGGLDFALLVDGLSAEREQGITIDVAYRYFTTDRRKFIVADTPGHEQYTRNMVTGASTASLGILILDSRKGILKQTKRHSFILSLLGIKNIILAINKLDLVNYDKKIYEDIKKSFFEFSKTLRFNKIITIPISALDGDNVVKKSTNFNWYKGQTLIEYLENFDEKIYFNSTLRIPIQYIIKNIKDFRGYAGTIVSGEMREKQKVKVLPSGFNTTISKIIEQNREVEFASTMKAVTFTLEDQIDISRGDFIVDYENPCDIADLFRVDLVWMDTQPFLSGRSYIIKMECRKLQAKFLIKFRYDINNFSRQASKTLKLNDIASCDLIFNEKIVYEKYDTNRSLGSFIVIDPDSNATCGAGRINFPLRRTKTIFKQSFKIDKVKRTMLKSHLPCIIWMTGISGAGKSTIADILEKKLYDMHIHTMLLDGDNIRNGLNKDLGFSDVDRIENIRRIGEVSKLLIESGLITIVSFISPFSSERLSVRNLVNKNEFFEVFIDTSLKEAEKRDPKGLYKKARSGEIPNFTGIGSPYEPPQNPEIHIKTLKSSPEESADIIIDYLKSKNILII